MSYAYTQSRFYGKSCPECGCKYQNHGADGEWWTCSCGPSQRRSHRDEDMGRQFREELDAERVKP